jgi:hypothetical protein
MSDAKSERELIIEVKGDVKNINQSIERLANILERLETVKFEGHEQRISRLERFTAQWGGALIAFNIAGVIIGIIIAAFK